VGEGEAEGPQGQENLMSDWRPSPSFTAFEHDVDGFTIQEHPKGGPLRFEAKQRMIARAEGIAIREAWLLDGRLLFSRKVRSVFMDGIKRCDDGVASSETSGGDDERHRPEIRLNLYARAVQQLTQRRLYTVAAVASVAAAVASVAAVAISVIALICR
jgi:hypothetical protein